MFGFIVNLTQLRDRQGVMLGPLWVSFLEFGRLLLYTSPHHVSSAEQPINFSAQMHVSLMQRYCIYAASMLGFTSYCC